MRKKWLLNDLAFLKNLSHTCNIEVFHSLCNNYCLKRLHFSYYVMIERSQLAILDYNWGIGLKQAPTKDGRHRFKQVYSKITERCCAKKKLCQKSRGYIEDLLQTTVDAQMTTIRQYCLLRIETIPKYVGSVEKPKKEEAIQSMQTRFEVSNTKIN